MRSLFWVYLTVMLALLVAYLFEIITWLILGERAAGWGSQRGEGGAAEQGAAGGGCKGGKGGKMQQGGQGPAVWGGEGIIKV